MKDLENVFLAMLQQALRDPLAKDPEGTVYAVTIRTHCKACAMAIAGHVPASVFCFAVHVDRMKREEGGAHSGPEVRLHTNTRIVGEHDGSPMHCSEHGRVTDFSASPDPGAVRLDGRQKT